MMANSQEKQVLSNLHRRAALVVDDEEIVRKTVKGFLETFGVDVVEAEDAPMAVKLAKENPDKLDLLITDVLLPYINGRDLANRISISRPGIKVLFISGYPLDVLQSHGLCPANVDLLLKPFTRMELGEKVDEILRRGDSWRAQAQDRGGTLAA